MDTLNQRDEFFCFLTSTLTLVEQLSERLEHAFHDLGLLTCLDLLFLQIQILSLHLLPLVFEVFSLCFELLDFLFEDLFTLSELSFLELQFLTLQFDHLIDSLQLLVFCFDPLILLDEPSHDFLGISCLRFISE